ncbi:hypothetical protein LVJ82_01090 [Vitreoscilla massiliensis]|uniref:Holin n=1 Tax=Vitreoscilla massiliensis TaxID=1689272 RepID=A0ABY4E441_9NEIS|nr:hypothetical protein [Vitreoscilla massiliensis]UOO89610.1 hypothetical protein LVJ82_01090 [Vitreoscilla massiliensis]
MKNPIASPWVKSFVKALAGNEVTGAPSHTKIWASVACATATWKFIHIPEPSVDIWMAYLGLVGGYALGRRWIAAKQDVETKKIEGTNNEE